MFGTVSAFGIFDSKEAYKGVKETKTRNVNEFEFEYVISCDKDAATFIGEKEVKLCPQTVIIRKPNEHCKSRLHFKCYYLHWKPREDNFKDLYTLPNVIETPTPEKYLKTFEAYIAHNLAADGNTADEYSLSKFFELLFYLKQDAKFCIDKKARRKSGHGAIVAAATEYMQTHYEEKITLQTLGEAVGYSPNRFQKIFTETTGVSPQKYLENVRIGRAKYLLAEGEKNFCEIAYECGFSSQAHFSAIFKKHAFLTPKEFRSAAISSYPSCRD